jgi:hypothetical protein
VSSPQPTQPTLFGRYQLLEPLAKGGMAEVFKAKLVAAAGTEKLLCIKRVLPQLTHNRDFISLFVKEARIALPLTHGNITQVFDFGEQDGVYYLAMEYIAGQNLYEVLKRVREVDRTLDLPASLHIAAEVCKGLHYAHTFTDPKGQPQVVVHRDVTPHNILISYNGEVKLTDFGIALAATKVASEDGVIRGKACYLSPEQADAHPGMPRSDIFSLGVVLYEMLTGIRPFEADGEAETLRRVREAQVEPPSQLNKEVDSSIDAIVLKALARNPDERYPRAGDMQVALGQILHKRWPDFTAEHLSTAMKDLFAWEIAQAEGAAGDDVRDRLLFQLSRAGIQVDADKTSTAELLELGTVAIGAAMRPLRRRKTWPRLAPLLAGVVLLAVLGVFLGLRYWPTDAGSGALDAGDELAAVAYGDEEHLPPEVRASPEPGTGAGSASPEPKRDPTRRLAAGMAYLNLNSWPWSVVYLDGRRLRGNTPLFRVKVQAGKHQLRFVNPELGMSREVAVVVDAGAVKTVAISLQQ